MAAGEAALGELLPKGLKGQELDVSPNAYVMMLTPVLQKDCVFWRQDLQR